jgi:hypothetical protein
MAGTAPDRRMFRYVVPVNDRPNVFDLSHSPVAVAAVGGAGSPLVEFWAEHAEDTPATRRAEDGLVWHLYEITDGSASA